MDFGQLTVANMGVDGGRVETGVSKDSLYCPEAGTSVHEMGRAGVTEQVACARVTESRLIEVAADHVSDATG